MPLYEYKCPKCGKTETIRMSIDSAFNKVIECECGSDMDRQISAPYPIFKGDGFYGSSD